jgi:hypothetical protein
MHVYMDESGDTGFKLDANSSTHFVVVALVVEQIEELRALIEGFRLNVGMQPRYELKFRTTRPEVRQRFFETILAADFAVAARVTDKRGLVHAAPPSRDAFYHDQLCTVLTDLGDRLTAATVVIDESVKSKDWQRATSAILRQHLNSGATRPIGEIRFRESRRDPLLQAADMVCGAVAQLVEHGASRYLDSLGERVLSIEWTPRRTQ